MSAQRLNARSIRRIVKATGLPVIRAWSHGGYVHDFVTQGHLHGWFSVKTGEWGFEDGPAMHYSTCPGGSGGAGGDALFPGGVPPLTAAEALAVLEATAGAPE